MSCLVPPRGPLRLLLARLLLWKEVGKRPLSEARQGPASGQRSGEQCHEADRLGAKMETQMTCGLGLGTGSR